MKMNDFCGVQCVESLRRKFQKTNKKRKKKNQGGKGQKKSEVYKTKNRNVRFYTFVGTVSTKTWFAVFPLQPTQQQHNNNSTTRHIILPAQTALWCLEIIFLLSLSFGRYLSACTAHAPQLNNRSTRVTQQFLIAID
jgi:hypothetical protein